MENNENITASYSQSPSPAPVTKWTGVDIAAAVLSVLFGYLICRAFPFSEHPLGAALILLLICAGAVVFVALKGTVRGAFSVIYPVIMVLLAATLFINPLTFVRFFSSVFFFTVLFYYLGRSAGVTIEKIAGKYLFTDVMKTTFVLPFHNYADIFPAIFHRSPNGDGKGAGKAGKVILFILSGLLVALIPTAIAIGMLSYDANFTRLLRMIFNFDISDVFSHAGSFICGIPIAMALFSAAFCTSRRIGSEYLKEAGAENRRRKAGFIPVVLSVTATIPVLLIYVIFFFSQKDYYLAAFSGVLPGNLSFADYAREGFFNLCGVTALNVVIIFVFSTFTRKKDDVSSTLPERICSVVFSLATLLLISTALAKMGLYVNEYGLTEKRVLASWLMILLFAVFTCVIIRQFIPKMSLPPVLAAVVLLFWGILGFCNVDALIADYNADAYLSGKLDTVDVGEIRNMGESGIPALIRLLNEAPADADENMTADVRYLASRGLMRQALADKYWHGEVGVKYVFSYDIASFRAIWALRDGGAELKDAVYSGNSSEPTFDSFGAIPPADPDEIKVNVILDLDEDIGLLLVDYDVNGRTGGGGSSNADRSMLKKDSKDLYWSISKQELGIHTDSSTAVDVVLKFSAVTEYFDPNYENDYPEEYVLPLGDVAFSARFGETYRVMITGNRLTGYDVILLG